MLALSLLLPSLFLLPSLISSSSSSEQPIVDPWAEKGYSQLGDLSFSGPVTFAHLPFESCLNEPETEVDVAVLGIPYDLSVSYRPGARFGPNAIRQGSRRQLPARGWNIALSHNPYQSGARVIDCGDVPTTPYDPAAAIDQIEAAYDTLLHRPTPARDDSLGTSFFDQISPKTGRAHPRIVSLGGDHTIALPILRSLNKVWGPVSVIHFDAHIDTWNPARYPGASSLQSNINHGTFVSWLSLSFLRLTDLFSIRLACTQFWKAYEEGLLRGNSSIHAGIRTRLTGPQDLEDDITAGFHLISTMEIDDYGGVDAIIKRIRDRVGTTNPVMLSFDIDVIDPSMAPATGTPESGGWTTREVRRILHGLRGLNFVAFDLVEVSPAYDTNAELTGIAAADIIFDMLSVLTLGASDRRAEALEALELEAKEESAHDEL
ncbi:arginase family-domain-containing protein [Mrakia frigida]|uniref:agmatinase n=1 Tax=Mrakia frigida TaxID=29902 RepID=UPI003FCC07CE